MLPHSTGSFLETLMRGSSDLAGQDIQLELKSIHRVHEKAVKNMIMSVVAFEFGLCDIVPTVIATTVIKETLTSKRVHIYIH